MIEISKNIFINSLNILDTLKSTIDRYFSHYEIYKGKYDEFNPFQFYLFFRGQMNYAWNLIPSINRTPQKYSENEILLYSVLNHANIEINQIIPFAQHYGIPTRGIDFTSNIKVALFFACYDIDKNKISDDMDGAIYICQYFPHKSEWISTSIINYLSIIDDKIIENKALASRLLEDKYFKEKYPEINHDRINNLCCDIAAYLPYGFMVIYDYDKERKNRRLVSQEGSLFYCGSAFYNGANYCHKIYPSTLKAPFYNIGIHEIQNPKLNEDHILKIRIPKNFKSRILKEIKITKNDLKLDI